VAELRENLDDFLRKNQTSLSTRPSNSTALSTFYEKLGSSSRSPTKRSSSLVEKVQDAVTSGDEAPKKGRRKTVAPLEESVEAIRDSAFLSNANRAATTVTDLVKTPAKELAEAVNPRRSSILASPGNLDTSPRAVADYLERNTRKASAYITDGFERTHITEFSEWARDALSSPLAFIALTFALELAALSRGLIELRHAFGIPVPFFGKVVPVSLPDVFVFITPEFLAPLTLFVTVNGILPILVGYFFNYSLKTASSHGHNTRRAAAAQEAAPLVDPLVYNIAKGLLAYLVYGTTGVNGAYPFSANTVSIVNSAIPFGYSGVVTSSFIGATIALYEAVLKK
jgi:hypothetical protein